MEGLEMISFQIISCVGSAKSMYMEEIFIKGHEAHASLIQKEAGGEPVTPNMLLMHAEDQLMAAESFKAFAQQQIIIFKKFQALENK